MQSFQLALLWFFSNMLLGNLPYFILKAFSIKQLSAICFISPLFFRFKSTCVTWSFLLFGFVFLLFCFIAKVMLLFHDFYGPVSKRNEHDSSNCPILCDCVWVMSREFSQNSKTRQTFFSYLNFETVFLLLFHLLYRINNPTSCHYTNYYFLTYFNITTDSISFFFRP